MRKASKGQIVSVRSNKGRHLGTVDRTAENPPFHTLIIAKLPCGYETKFWIPGLSDREYLRRTRYCKKHNL